MRRLIIVLVLLATGSQASASGVNRATMRGLLGVHVIVETFSTESQKVGFTRSTFQTDAELKLRLAGIKVLSEAEWLRAPGDPFLYVGVQTLASPETPSAPFSIRVGLNQLVLLERDATKDSVFAETWNVGLLGKGDVDYVRNSAKLLLDKFLNTWLSVNPKK